MGNPPLIIILNQAVGFSQNAHSDSLYELREAEISEVIT